MSFSLGPQIPCFGTLASHLDLTHRDAPPSMSSAQFSGMVRPLGGDRVSGGEDETVLGTIVAMLARQQTYV